MSKSDQQTQTDASELSDDELLERIAAKDPDEVPLAAYARRGLDQEDSS